MSHRFSYHELTDRAGVYSQMRSSCQSIGTECNRDYVRNAIFTNEMYVYKSVFRNNSWHELSLFT